MSDFKIVKLLDPLLVALGIPVGGTTGQVLKKASNANYDTVWGSGGGGGGGQVDTVVAGEGVTVVSTDPVNPVVSIHKTFTIQPNNPTVLGYDKDNPYILGTNGEDILYLDTSLLEAEAFILINGTTSLDKIYYIRQVVNNQQFYIATDDAVAQWIISATTRMVLANFNNLHGFLCDRSQSTVEVLGHAGNNFELYKTNYQIENVSFGSGYDNVGGVTRRETMTGAQYSALTGVVSADSYHFHNDTAPELLIDPSASGRTQIYVLSDGVASPNNHRILRLMGSTGVTKDIMDWIE